MPGQTWQCWVPGQPQTALEASRRELSGAQAVGLPAMGFWGSWLPRGAPTLLTLVLDIFFRGCTGSRECRACSCVLKPPSWGQRKVTPSVYSGFCNHLCITT